MQALAQAAALVLVLEPVQVRELVSAVEPLELELVSAVKPLVLVLEQVQVLELAVEPLAQAREPPLVREPAQQSELAAVPESPQSQEPAVKPERVREPRVSRQLELQQHRLPTAAQERPPYLPALPMKAPYWGVPA